MYVCICANKYNCCFQIRYFKDTNSEKVKLHKVSMNLAVSCVTSVVQFHSHINTHLFSRYPELSRFLNHAMLPLPFYIKFTQVTSVTHLDLYFRQKAPEKHSINLLRLIYEIVICVFRALILGYLLPIYYNSNNIAL